MADVLKKMTVCGVAALFIIGCNDPDRNKAAFTKAINTYYATHPSCLWDASKKFPVQVTASDDTKTTPYDALVDQGLLQRTAGEKKVFLLGSKDVTNYDISDQGRASWTPDVSQPGYGNFCYGHPVVQSIESSSATTDHVGARTLVTYVSTFTGVPSWASATETQNAFPQLHADVSGPQTNSATLLNTSSGWQFQPAPPSHKSTTAADGSIVQ
jgi:hypothetical protein